MNLNVNVNLEQSHAQLHMHHRLTGYIIIATIHISPAIELNKSSAVAEMGDRGHNRHGPKIVGLLCPFRGSWDPVEYNVAWAEVYFRTSGVFIHPAIWPQ